jgi:hypothetical protein
VVRAELYNEEHLRYGDRNIRGSNLAAVKYTTVQVTRLPL